MKRPRGPLWRSADGQVGFARRARDYTGLRLSESADWGRRWVADGERAAADALEALLAIDAAERRALAGNDGFSALIGAPADHWKGQPLGALLVNPPDAEFGSTPLGFSTTLRRFDGGETPVRALVWPVELDGVEAFALRLEREPVEAPWRLDGVFPQAMHDAPAPILLCDYGEARRRAEALDPPERADFELWLAQRPHVAHGVVAGARVLAANEAAEALLGDASDGGRALGPLHGAQDLPTLSREIKALRDGAERFEAETFAITADGRRLDLLVAWRTASFARASHDVVYVVYADITARKQAEAAMRHRAEHDPLTGLPNRQVFHDRLERAIAQARRRRVKVAALAVDLDLFKSVNDRFGHPAGDELLKVTAARITASLRESDSICRLGGDEFAVLLPNLRAGGDAAVVGRKILRALEEPVALGSAQIATGASIGIAIFPDDADAPDALMKLADVALYRAKAEGRGRFRFFVPSMNDEEETRRDLERRFAEALENERLTLFYQPLRRLADSRLLGFEALLRWRIASGDLLRPAEFLPGLANTAMMRPLAFWSLREAAWEAARWRAVDPALEVAVNLTEQQLRVSDLAIEIETILAETRLPPEALTLDVDASAFDVVSSSGPAAAMRKLASWGVGFSLDDVGEAPMPLLALGRSPFGRLKLARKFVANLTEDEEAEAVARAAIGCGRAFGLLVVAKGVEHDGQVGHLKALGCDAAQGFAIEPPMEAEAARAMVERERAARGGGQAEDMA